MIAAAPHPYRVGRSVTALSHRRASPVRKRNAFGRSSADRGDDVCFFLKEGLGPANVNLSVTRTDVGRRPGARHLVDVGRRTAELRRQIACMRSTYRRHDPLFVERRARLRPLLEAEQQSRAGSPVYGGHITINWTDVFARRSAEHICPASPPPAVAKGTKARSYAEPEADGEFSGMPGDAMRRELEGMSDGALRREIADLRSTLHRFQPLLALLEAEARRRQGSTRTKDGDDRSRGARSDAKSIYTFDIYDDAEMEHAARR